MLAQMKARGRETEVWEDKRTVNVTEDFKAATEGKYFSETLSQSADQSKR